MWHSAFVVSYTLYLRIHYEIRIHSVTTNWHQDSWTPLWQVCGALRTLIFTNLHQESYTNTYKSGIRLVHSVLTKLWRALYSNIYKFAIRLTHTVFTNLHKDSYTNTYKFAEVSELRIQKFAYSTPRIYKFSPRCVHWYLQICKKVNKLRIYKCAIRLVHSVFTKLWRDSYTKYLRVFTKICTLQTYKSVPPLVHFVVTNC